jgi:hypothetical protein
MSVVIGGCGSDDSDDGTTTAAAESITKEEFIEQGDRLCQEFRNEVAPLERKAEAEEARRDYQAVADLFGETVGAAKETYERFDALPVPEGEEDAVSSYLDVQNRQIAVAEQLAEAIRLEDADRIAALTEEAQRIDAEAGGIAQGIGFEVCGQD